MKLLSTIKRGRVFYRILLSYLLVLLIPLVLTFVLFDNAHNRLEAEGSRANEQLLDQMAIYIDRIMADVQTTTRLITNNERMKGFIHLRPPVDTDERYRAYSIAQDFSLYFNSGHSIIKFYTYINALDLIISHSGFYSSREYYFAQQSKVIRDNTYQGYSEWMNLFKGPNHRWFKTMQTETETENVVSTIAMIIPMPVGQKLGTPKGWMVIEIDLDEFHKVFDNTAWADSGILLVNDREAGILISSNPDISMEQLETEKIKIKDFSNGDLVSVGADKYVFNYRHSREMGSWDYVSLVPCDIYAGQFETMSRIAALAFGLCFVIGVSLIYWSANQRYKPVRNLLSLLAPDEEGNVSLQSDEFKMITETLESTIAKNQRLRQEVDKANPLLSQRLLRQLLTMEEPFDEAAEAQLAHYGIQLPHRFLILVIIEFELAPHTDPTQDTLMRESCVSAFLQSVQSGISYTIRNLSVRKYEYYYPERGSRESVGLLINDNRGTSDDLYARLVKSKQQMEIQFPMLISIGISSAHEKTPPLNTISSEKKANVFSVLSREARMALWYRLIKGRYLPIRFAEIKNARQAYYYPLEQEQKLINSIKAGNFALADAILDDVYRHNFGDSLMSLPMATCLMFDLIASLVRSIDAVLGDEQDSNFWYNLRPIYRMMRCNSFEQLRVEMRALLKQVCRTVVNSQKSHNEVLRDQILAHIHEQYQDQNLCPDSIAEKFNRNKAYISRFFREQTAVGISSYIKQYRVSKAKQLLLNDTVTIADLAWHLGFSGSNAFIRAFKEIEGITPGQYKAAHQSV